MTFKWYPPKAQTNLEKHGVSFEEAQTVFDDPAQLHLPDHAHSIGEQRYHCFGMSDQGRRLMVGYTEPAADTIHIITAREMTRREQQEYESQSDLT